MPTQELTPAQIAALDLEAADNAYAQTQARMDKITSALKTWSDAVKNNPNLQNNARLNNAVAQLSDEYAQLKNTQYTNELRRGEALQQVNYYNELAAQQQPQVTSGGGQRRRVVTPTNDQLRLRQYLDAGYVVGSDGLVYTPGGQLVNQNGYNINANGQFVPAQTVIEGEQTPAGETTTALPPQLQATINKLSQSNQSVTPTPQINPAITTTSKPGTLTSGGSNRATVGEYLGNVWNGITQTYMKPSELVYQSNSRLPGYNLGANIGRVGTVGTVLAGGWGGAAPTTTTVPSTFAMPKYTGAPKVTTNIPKYVNTLPTNPNVAALRRNVFVNTLR